MKRLHLIFLRPFRFLTLAFLSIFVACVSINIKSKAPIKSIAYSYQEPDSPFKKMNSEQADAVWQNPATGHAIAVLSECSETHDPSLSALEEETLQALNNHRITKSFNFSFQERDALRSSVEGSLDGIPVRMEIMTFKKNSCNYTLTYMGRTQGFVNSLPAFEKFLQGFQVR